jgi:hypothetical protein
MEKVDLYLGIPKRLLSSLVILTIKHKELLVKVCHWLGQNFSIICASCVPGGGACNPRNRK